MKKALLAIALLAVSAMVVTSCGKNKPIALTIKPDQGNISFALSAPEDITSGQVIITKGSF